MGLRDAVEGAVGMAVRLGRGMGVTLKNALRPPVTVQYPEYKEATSEHFRMFPALVVDEATDKLKCTACMACVKACPVDCIWIKGARDRDSKPYPETFYVDMSWCMECALCVEACPFDALEMAPDYELAGYDVRDLLMDKDQLAAIKRPPKTPWTRRKASYLEGPDEW